MDIYEIISSNQTQAYITKVFGTTIGLGDFIFWIVLSLIIGFMALTIRYTFNPKDKNEYELWKNEHWPTKIFICLMNGGLSFITIELFFELMGSLNYLIFGSMDSFNLVWRKSVLGNILLSIVYSSGVIWVLGKRGNTYYNDLKKFSLFSLFAPIFLAILTTSLLVMKVSIIMGFSFLGFAILLFIMVLIPFYIKPKNYQNKPNLKKKKK